MWDDLNVWAEKPAKVIWQHLGSSESYQPILSVLGDHSSFIQINPVQTEFTIWFCCKLHVIFLFVENLILIQFLDATMTSVWTNPFVGQKSDGT